MPTSDVSTSRHFAAVRNLIAIEAISDIEQGARFASVQSPLGRRVAVPVEGLVACGDHHALGIEMVVKAFGAELAPDAGVIDPAPGRGRIEAVMIVDPDDAGLDAGGDAMRAGDVAGPDRSGKPERRIIGEPQRGGFVL